MAPKQKLPHGPEYANEEAYVEALLHFVTHSTMLQSLCGGLHILDFLTSTPDLYESNLPADWREWLRSTDISTLLDVLMRDEIPKSISRSSESLPTAFESLSTSEQSLEAEFTAEGTAKGIARASIPSNSLPKNDATAPPSLLAYISTIRNLSLNRSFKANSSNAQQKRRKLSRHITVGMKPKKAHEVEHLAAYIDRLTTEIAQYDASPHTITHLVDLGSGQNYLGRALASPPYQKAVVAVESKPRNIVEARSMDVSAKLAPKERVLRNKKVFRAGVEEQAKQMEISGCSGLADDGSAESSSAQQRVTCQQEEQIQERKREKNEMKQQSQQEEQIQERIQHQKHQMKQQSKPEELTQERERQEKNQMKQQSKQEEQKTQSTWLANGSSNIQYVEHIITDGNLDFVVKQLQGALQPRNFSDHENLSDHEGFSGHEKSSAGVEPVFGESDDAATKRELSSPTTTTSTTTTTTKPSLQAISPSNLHCDTPQLMVVSLHSCGNLLHHGLRSLVLNPAVQAVALVGCCYNLVTERLGPPTFKLPNLRSTNTRLLAASAAHDPHGFPLSARLAHLHHAHGTGLRLNITARMLAVQAPQNWTPHECDAFFTRHFFRALLQRVFLDCGIVPPPTSGHDPPDDVSPRGWSGGGPALVLGSLRKACYASFVAYVRGAAAKLDDGTARGTRIAAALASLSDEEIAAYERRYGARKHELCVVWSLMAFSAAVIESTIVVDRWLFLREQDEVRDCWVETVFEYAQSPRNLVVVGIKR